MAWAGHRLRRSRRRSPHRVRAATCKRRKLVNKVQPDYPPLARQTRISGTVRLHAIIAKNGTVEQLEVMSGHPLLVQAALDAVSSGAISRPA